MKKLVIHCASGIKNSGDEAILQALLQLYRERFEITVLTLNQEYSSQMHSGISVLASSDTGVCKAAIDDCDLFILGGGGLLQDTTTIFNVSRWLSYLRYAISKGKETYVYANSVGPLHYGMNRKWVKDTLSKASRITVRDELSQKLLKDLGIASQLTADPVYGLDFETQSTSQVFEKKWQGQVPKEYIAVSIRHWFDTIPFIPVSICTKYKLRNHKKYNRYIKELREFVTYVNEKKGLPVVFVSFCYGRDSKVAWDILDTPLLQEKNMILNEEYATPADLYYIIKKAKVLIGMRLHSIIYAVKAGCVCVPMIYESKVASMVDMLGLKALAVDVNTFTGSELSDNMEQALGKKDVIVADCYEKCKHFMEMNQKNIIED